MGGALLLNGGFVPSDRCAAIGGQTKSIPGSTR